MHTATLTIDPHHLHSYRELEPDNFRRKEWAYRPQYAFKLTIGESQCDICFEALKEFPERNQFATLLPQVNETAFSLFKNGERLRVFSSNQFGVWEAESGNHSLDAKNLPVVALELSEKEYSRLLNECNKKNLLHDMIRKFSSYLFSLSSPSCDEYTRPCFDFIEQCYINSIDHHHKVQDLRYIRSDYLNSRLKSDSLENAKRALYSKIGVPNFYEFEPNISLEIERIYQTM